MTTASAVDAKKSNQNTIQQNTLLEELYTYYSLTQLQAMLESEPDKLLLQNWKVTSEELRENLALAVDFVKND